MTTRGTTVARNGAFLLAGEVAVRLGGIALVLVLARVYGPAGFGAYSAALALASLLLVIADPGLSVLATRDVARDPGSASQRLGQGLSLKLWLSAAMVIAAAAGSNLLGQKDLGQLAVAVAIGMAVGSFSTYVRSLFRAFEQMNREASTRITEQAIVMTFGLAVAASGYSLLTVVWSLAVGRLVGFVVTLAECTKCMDVPAPSRNGRAQVALLVAALPLAFSGILDSIIFYTDSLMLSAMRGASSVGLYGAAQRPLAATLVLPGVLAAALLPGMSRDSRSDPAAFSAALLHSLKLAGALAVVLVAVVVPTTGGWVGLLFGRAYLEASSAMGWLAGAVGVVYLTTLTGHALVASDRQWKHLRFAAAGAALNVGLNLLLIPRMDFTGAALASLVSQVFMLTMELYALRDLVELRGLRAPALKLVAAGCTAFVVAQVMTTTLGTTPTRLLLITTPASLASYAGAVAALGVLDPAERAALRSLLRRALHPRATTLRP